MAAVRRLLASPRVTTGAVILLCFVIVAVIGGWVSPYNPSATSTAELAPPSGAHLLGTTQTGQDVLSQVLSGTAQSMAIAFLAGLIATALSVIIGVSAGYFGKLAGEGLSALANIFLVIPALPLVIVLTGYLSDRSTLTLAVVISVTGWAFGARVLRAQTLSLRNRDYVLAARAAGEKPWRVIVFEILPGLVPIIASSFLFTVIFAIVTQAGLAFLGLTDLSSWSWGTMLYFAQNFQAFTLGAWWWYVPPGVCIALLGMALGLINFGIDEFVNPRLRLLPSGSQTRRAAAAEPGIAEVRLGDQAPAAAATPSRWRRLVRRPGLRWAAGVVVVVLGLSLAAGLGGGSSSSGATGVLQAGGGGVASKGAPGGAGVTSLTKGCPAGPRGTLNFVGDTGGPYPYNFNPFAYLTNAAGALYSFVYEPLLQFSLSNSKSIQGWLASSYAWSDGGKTLTFHLRHGVSWSDGKPFTSADVVYSFQMLKANPALNLKGLQFKTVSATGPYTVTMTFAQPSYVDLFYIGTEYMLPKHIWSHISNPGHYANLHPVGTGPYQVKSLSSQSLTLVARQHYWLKDLPCVAKIVAPTYVSNTTADLAMEQGGGDWGGVYIPGINRYTSASTDNQYWFPPVQTVTLYPNLTKAPMNNVALRQAMSLALNRTQIALVSDEAEEQPVTNQTGLILPRDNYLLASKYAQASYSYSPSKARALLTKAGFTLKDGKLQAPDGKPVSLSLIVPSAFSDYVAGVQEIARELQEIGINVTVDTISNTEWTTRTRLGQFDLSIQASLLGPTSFYQYDGWLDTTQSAPIGQGAAANYERYHSATADRLLDQYQATNNPAQQKALMAKLETLFIKDLPVIPMFYQTSWGNYTTSKFIGWPTPKNPYQISSSYDSPMNEIVLLHLRPRSGS
jgi:peptide/nickel transport system substrate-binding protein